MAATWKIGPASAGYDDASCKTLAQLGITDLRIKFANHADDVATWTCDGADVDSAADFATGTVVSIWRKNGQLAAKRVFSGAITSLPRYGSGAAHRVSYEARGGWYWLTKGFYTQSYPVHDGTTAGTCSKTRIVIGYGANGTATPTAQLAEILNQCAAASGEIAGTAAGSSVSVSSATIPGDEELDLTWADAVNRILRWFPDTAVFFDHSVHPVKCTIERWTETNPDRTRWWGAGDCDEVEVVPRHDLQIPGVRIDYEIVTSVESGSGDNLSVTRYRNVESDTAGSPSALGAAHFTVEIDGGTKTTLKQKITVENLPATLPVVSASGTKPGSAWQTFFAKYIPELCDKTLTAFSCDKTWFPENLNHVLLTGQVQPWFPRTRTAKSVAMAFTASYADGSRSVVGKTFSVTLTLTNAATGTYTATTSTAGADVPTGLAAALYAAMGRLWYEGRIVRTQADVLGTASPGESLALGGVLPGGGTAYGFVQSEEWDVGNGKTTVSFGPPNHLGVQDLVQLAQANRKRRPVESQSAKASASVDAGQDDDMTLGGPAPDTHEGETEGLTDRQVFAVSTAAGSPKVEVHGSGNFVAVVDGSGNRAVLGDVVSEEAGAAMGSGGLRLAHADGVHEVVADGTAAALHAGVRTAADAATFASLAALDGAAGTLRLKGTRNNSSFDITLPGDAENSEISLVTDIDVRMNGDGYVTNVVPVTATFKIEGGLITEVSGGGAQNGNE